jgi:hypothetical protein
MNGKAVRDAVTGMAISLMGLCSLIAQSIPATTAASPENSAKALPLERSDGELRTRRIHTDGSAPASSQFVLKVSPKNNGFQYLVAGTGEVPPGRPYRDKGTWPKTNSC